MVFDVPGWLASVANCEREQVALEGEVRRAGALHLRYRVEAHEQVRVRLRALGQARGRASGWEVVATVGKRIERVEVPAGTRFAWR
jgi:hypothetical protein